jgi:hypothetical protein
MFDRFLPAVSVICISASFDFSRNSLFDAFVPMERSTDANRLFTKHNNTHNNSLLISLNTIVIDPLTRVCACGYFNMYMLYNW